MSKATADKLIKKMSDFVKAKPDIFSGPFKKLKYNDEPKLNIFNVNIVARSPVVARGFKLNCGGVDFDENTALLKTLGESLERYSSGVYQSRNFKSLSCADVSRTEHPFPLHKILNTVKYPSKRKNFFSISNSDKLKWISAKEIISGHKSLVPAQMVFLPYVFNKEKIIRLPNSSGVALHSSGEKAILSAIYELVERDAFLLSYFLKKKLSLINIDKSTKQIENLKKYFEDYNLELYVVQTLTDLSIYSIAAVLIDRTGVGPSVSVGLRAGIELEDAIIGAINEAQYGRIGTRELRNRRKKLNINDTNNLNSIQDRALFWYPLSRIKKINFLISGKETPYSVVRENNFEKFKDKEHDSVLKTIEEKGYEAYAVNITPKEISRKKLFVMRLIMPDLQWLYLEESYKIINIKRISKFKNGIKIKEINNFPHPFL